MVMAMVLVSEPVLSSCNGEACIQLPQHDVMRSNAIFVAVKMVRVMLFRLPITTIVATMMPVGVTISDTAVIDFPSSRPYCCR